ncbi:MAG TPA: ABC transporter substrate-binding protein [Candidatus Udaeobacter sp.]|nr:ABC transporter substrate-binding protein [Candidatus Udaeobacter sp.]
MKNIFRIRFADFPSDNLKSKIQNQKWVGFLAIVVTLVIGGAVAQAQQQRKIPRIGVLLSGSSSSYVSRVEAFRQGLRDLGYVEGQNIVIDYRYAEGKMDQFAILAAELVRLKPDILVTSGSPGIRALMKTTNKIPIVMAAIGDAVGNRFVASLARPGGNVTGLSFLDRDISTKRLEFLKEAIPRAVRVAVLRHGASGKQSLEATLAASRPLKIQVQVFEIQAPNEIEGAFIAAKKDGAEAINVLASAILFSQRKALVDLAAKHRLPGMFENKEFVEAGGLLSYGASLDDMFRRAATYVDKILKGAKPGELPVEQPTKFELVINLKTAKQIGLTIPPNVLAQADKLIR